MSVVFSTQADESTLKGGFVVSLQGSFNSAPPPPFPPDILRFDTVLLGKYRFDGLGNVEGRHFITFSNAAIPFDVRSEFNAFGTYAVGPDGSVLMDMLEDAVHPVHGADGTPDASFTIECSIVSPQQTARCALYSLVSLQGPVPKLNPATLSGSIERQSGFND